MKNNRVPDILVEQLLLGELPEARRAELLADPAVQARLQELQASNREILERYPPEVYGQRIGWRLKKGQAGRRERSRRVIIGLRFAAGMAAMLVVALLVVAAPWRRTDEVTRVKGARPHLVIYRKAAAGAEAVAAGSAVQRGDVLQIGYVSASRPFGAIFSIDGRGVLTLHYPGSEAGATARLEGEGEVLLDYAYQLDDAPEFERFFLVTSPRELPLAEVLAAGRRLAADPKQARKAGLGLPAGLEQWSVLLLKK